MKRDDFPVITFADDEWLTKSEVFQIIQMALAGIGFIALSVLAVWAAVRWL